MPILGTIVPTYSFKFHPLIPLVYWARKYEGFRVRTSSVSGIRVSRFTAFSAWGS